MWGSLDRFRLVLADAAVAETLFLTLVILAMIFCHQPARRIRLGKTAVLFSLFMLPLVAYTPFPRISPGFWFAELTTARAVAKTHVSWIETAPHAVGLVPWPAELTTGRLLTLAYLAGVGLGLLGVLLGFALLAQLIRQSRSPSPSLAALYENLLDRLEQRRHAPHLLVSDQVRHPILAGVLRPSILIPGAYDGARVDPDSLRIILTHELEHARESDSRFSALASLGQSLWFFIPFLWWLRAQLRADQEFLADQRSARLCGSQTTYAQRLVALAATSDPTGARRPILGSVSMVSGNERPRTMKSLLLQRVVMLLQCPFQVEDRPPRSWTAAAWLLVTGLALACSGISVATSGAEPARAISAAAVVQSPHQFQVAEFMAPPQVRSRTGRSLAYVLPLPLPARWTASMEIQASTLALRQIRIAGLLLGCDVEAGNPPADDTAGDDDATTWHRVQIHHAGRRNRITIDGQTCTTLDAPSSKVEWLTIEPSPTETAVLRGLTIAW